MFRNKRRLKELEEEVEFLKTEKEISEESLREKDEAIRKIYRLLNNIKAQNIYGEAGYRTIFRQINEIIDENVEKKLSDEIFPHFTSNS